MTTATRLAARSRTRRFAHSAGRSLHLAIATGVLALACGGGFDATATAEVPEKVTFDDHIKPIFRENCLACHDQSGRSGDLALDTYNDTLTGGASGEVVEPGAGDASRLYRLVAHLDKPEMPPGDQIPDDQLELIKAWIDGGLLENAGSKAKKSSKPAVAAFVPSADNRPEGEPAMPGGFYREPVLRAPQAGAVAEVAASPWAPLVAVAGQRQVLLYHADSRELLAIVPFVVGNPDVIRFSRNGDLLLVAGGRGAALGVGHLWQIKTGRRIAEIGDEVDEVLAADISADHSLVALGGPRKLVKVFHTADSSLAHTITKHTDWVTALEFSPSGEYLVTADRAGNAHLWESATGRPVAALGGHSQSISSVSWRGDSQLLVTASEDGDFRTWQADGTQVKQWSNGSGVLDVAFTKDGQIVSAGRDRLAKLWSADGKEIRKLAPMNDIALAVAPTHDGKFAVVSDWSGEVRVAALETGEEAGQLPANPPTLAMRIAAAEQAITKASEQIPVTQASLVKVDATIKTATAAVARHQDETQAAKDTLAKLEQQQQQATAKLAEHREALAKVDRSVAEVARQQEATQKELARLKDELAKVANQQGDEADGQAEDELTAEINEAEAKLTKIADERKQAEAPRPAAAEAVKSTEQTVADLAKQLDQQKQVIASLKEAAAQLPDVAKLTADRDRLKEELTKHEATKKQAEERIARLKAEQEEYAAAVPNLKTGLTEREQQKEEQTVALAKVKEQLAEEQKNVETVTREIDQLKQRIADLEKVHQQLAEIADKTRTSAGEMEQQIGELSSEQAQIQKTIADLEAAAELRQQLKAAD